MTSATPGGQPTDGCVPLEAPPSIRRRELGLAPVGAVGGEHGLAARGLSRPVQRVGGGAPDRIVRSGAMRLERRLVLIDLVKVVRVLVLLVLQDVEPEAAGLVPFGAERVRF